MQSYLALLAFLVSFQNDSWLEELNTDIVSIENIVYENVAKKDCSPGIPSKHSPYSFKWADSDAKTDFWYPQGITGNKNHNTSLVQDQRILLVSWYGVESKDVENKHMGVRISLIQFNPDSSIQYQHALLVQDIANQKDSLLYDLNENQKQRIVQLGSYIPVPIHAGGIAWYGNYLYVADTYLGLRVFDLSRIFKTKEDSSQRKCGVDETGNFYAFGYSYAIPQIAYYKKENANNFSCLSLGINEHTVSLWTANYVKPNNGNDQAFVYQIPLGENGELNTENHLRTHYPKLSTGETLRGIQGVNVIRNNIENQSWYSVKTKGRDKLYILSDGKLSSYRWKDFCEDLYYESEHRRMWSLSELHKGLRHRRRVFSVDTSSYLD